MDTKNQIQALDSRSLQSVVERYEVLILDSDNESWNAVRMRLKNLSKNNVFTGLWFNFIMYGIPLYFCFNKYWDFAYPVLNIWIGTYYFTKSISYFPFFSVLNVPFFSVLLKNATFFSVIFLSFWRLMKPKRTLRSFPFFCKEH